ncbi:hypothetical protein [Runella sp.]|uniref:hypothetical protein n=1 Tax=Runella sp. TaxID=1960881 RepID=UPI003D0B594E
MNDLHLGQRVKKVIERSSDTIKEAAIKLGESEPNIYKKFKMKDLSTEFIRRVANQYRVPFSSFFTESQYNSTSQLNDSNMTQSQKLNNFDMTENQILKERLKASEEKIVLLSEQIELYKKLIK